MKKVLILANDVTTVLQFRSELVKTLVDKGHTVYVSVPNNVRTKEISDLGATVIETAVSRHGKNPIKDLKLYLTYKKLIKTLKPDIVFGFTIKPNVYGGKACAVCGVPFIANVTGLGIVERKSILQKITLSLYKKGVKKAKCVFFQNADNMKFFVDHGIVKSDYVLLPGSGVNLEKFSYVDYPTDETTNFVFVGRIIKDKGVYELASVAKSLLDRNDIRFTVVGEVEYGSENPFTGIENVNCVGFHKDVKPYLADAHAIVLPSYHEGMANVLLEAAATGRPILASDIPGCRETFDDGISGFGFKKCDALSLKEAILKFSNLPIIEKEQMGKRARQKIENEFDRNTVIEKYLEQIDC